jgi:putative ABC transport system permease protein
MLQSYLVIAWRNLLKHKAFSFINILGLAIGLAACLLILQYAGFELSYDRFHQKADRIYRVGVAWFKPNGELDEKGVGNFGPAGPALRRDLPEVEAFARFRPWFSGTVVQHGEVSLPQEKIYFADAGVFSVFSLLVLQGDASLALSQPHSAVLSQSTARKYFGNREPLGKVILLKQGKDQKPFTVKAVYADLPANSHFQFEMLLSYGDLGEIGETSWGWSDVHTYVLVRAGTRISDLEKKGQALLAKYRESQPGNPKGEVAFIWQPLKDIHLYSDLRYETQSTGSGRMVHLLLVVGVLILLIAYANYINLSTARATARAREVGLRKAIGATRTMLVGQFLLEAVLVNTGAILLAVTLVQALQAPFSRWTGQVAGLVQWSPWALSGGLLGLLLASILGSGAYPALVLSGFRPIAALKGKVAATQGHSLRRTLVVIQFMISLFLMAGTLLVYRQLSFMRNGRLGVDIEQILVVKTPVVRDSLYGNKAAALKATWLAYPAVTAVTASSEVPGQAIGWSFNIIHRKGVPKEQAPSSRVLGVDHDFVKTYGLQLVAGRGFSQQFSRDKKGLLINEEAARVMGFASPQAAVGAPMVWDHRDDGEGFAIIGVVRNFHQQGLQHPFDPVILTLDHTQDTYFSCKVRTGTTAQTLNRVQAVYGKFFPGSPFDYFFLDDHFARQYKADQQFGEVFTGFAGLAIFIACLGLLGLVAYLTVQRSKEIGVRKVLGASLLSLLLLLLKDVFKWMLLAILLAAPFTWWFSQRWLSTYAFRIQPGFELLLLPAGLVLLTALLSVIYQTTKAAKANPVHSLRNE